MLEVGKIRCGSTAVYGIGMILSAIKIKNRVVLDGTVVFPDAVRSRSHVRCHLALLGISVAGTVKPCSDPDEIILLII